MLPNLTSIRFFLASLVILSHIPDFCKNRGFPYFNDWAIFFKGKEAVYVFFTLSGFLIIRNLIREKESTHTINLKAFYTRRVLRIFPLYYFVLAIGFVYYNIVIQFFGYERGSNYDIVEGILLGITFFANILTTYKPGGILEVLWSIAIEEQFYIIIAPLFLMIRTAHILKFLLLFTTVYFIAYNLPLFKILKEYQMLYFYFSAGGILAYLSLYGKPKINIYFKTVIFSLFILLLTTNTFKEANDTIYQLLCMITFSSTIYLLALKPYPLLEQPIFNYLGKISYGLYMYHCIVVQVIGFAFMRLTHINSTLFIILFHLSVFSLTLFVSAVSYRYFETPFLKLKKPNKKIIS